MAVFAVTMVNGPAWDPAVQRRQQAGWDAHARYMDGLVADGRVILGGPIGDGSDVLVVHEAADQDDLRATLAADPWADRILKPGGALHFVEHGLAQDERVRRWQHRLEPLQKRLFGGCHITRPILDIVGAAGFTVTAVDEFYDAGPKPFVALSLGTAVRA